MLLCNSAPPKKKANRLFSFESYLAQQYYVCSSQRHTTSSTCDEDGLKNWDGTSLLVFYMVKHLKRSAVPVRVLYVLFPVVQL